MSSVIAVRPHSMLLQTTTTAPFQTLHLRGMPITLTSKT